MLVLTRNEMEQIVITTPAGERIVVTVLEAQRGKGRLAINAPPDVVVDRMEIDLRKRQGIAKAKT